MKFEENWPSCYREVVQRCGQMDERGQMASDQITHPEPCSGELKTRQKQDEHRIQMKP